MDGCYGTRPLSATANKLLTISSKEACDLILARGVFQQTKYSVRHRNMVTGNPQQLSEVVTD